MCVHKAYRTDSNSHLSQVLIQELLNWSNHTHAFTVTTTVTATVTFPHILKYKGSVLFRVSREKFAWTSMIAATKLMVIYAEVSQLLMGNCQVWQEMNAGWMMKMVLANIWYQNYIIFSWRQYRQGQGIALMSPCCYRRKANTFIQVTCDRKINCSEEFYEFMHSISNAAC